MKTLNCVDHNVQEMTVVKMENKLLQLVTTQKNIKTKHVLQQKYIKICTYIYIFAIILNTTYT
jgi:hypothetical protein